MNSFSVRGILRTLNENSPYNSRMSLILQNLSKSYPTRSGDLVVLRDVNLTLQDGDAARRRRPVRLRQEHAALPARHA